jgi:hypothetical protein
VVIQQAEGFANWGKVVSVGPSGCWVVATSMTFLHTWLVVAAAKEVVADVLLGFFVIAVAAVAQYCWDIDLGYWLMEEVLGVVAAAAVGVVVVLAIVPNHCACVEEYLADVDWVVFVLFVVVISEWKAGEAAAIGVAVVVAAVIVVVAVAAAVVHANAQAPQLPNENCYRSSDSLTKIDDGPVAIANVVAMWVAPETLSIYCQAVTTDLLVAFVVAHTHSVVDNPVHHCWHSNLVASPFVLMLAVYSQSPPLNY